MRLSYYYHSPVSRVLATLLGIMIGSSVALVGLFTGRFVGWIWGLLTGAGGALVLSFLIPIVLWRSDAPYRRIKETIKPPLLLDKPVRFTVRGGSLSGFLILTKESLVLLSLERGDHRMELSKTDVKSMVMDETETSIRIFLNDKQYIRIFSASCQEIFETFRQEGWN